MALETSRGFEAPNLPTGLTTEKMRLLSDVSFSTKRRPKHVALPVDLPVQNCFWYPRNFHSFKR